MRANVLYRLVIAGLMLLFSGMMVGFAETAPTPLTLPDVIQLALLKNPALQRAVDQTVLAKSRYQQQWANLLPNTVVRSENRRFNLPFIADQRTAFSPTVELQLTVNGNQPFVIRESKRWWDAAVFDRDDVTQDTLADVTNAYYDAMEARLQVANADLAITEAKTMLTLASQGAVANEHAEDRVRAQARLVQQQRRLTTAVNDQQQTLQTLRQWLNSPPEEDLTLALVDPAPVKLVPDAITQPALLERLRSQHPQLHRLQAEQQALENQVRQELTRWLPQINSRAYWGTTGPDVARQTYAQDAGIIVQMAVLERMGFAIPLRVTERKATVRQKQAEYTQALRQLETDVIQSRLDSQAFLDNLDQVAQEKKLAQQNYDQGLKRYQENELPFVALVDAQDALINARTNFVQTVFNYNRAQVRQLQAIGAVNPQHLQQGL
jgi:outer membrane protein TolC